MDEERRGPRVEHTITVNQHGGVRIERADDPRRFEALARAGVHVAAQRVADSTTIARSDAAGLRARAQLVDLTPCCAKEQRDLPNGRCRYCGAPPICGRT